MDSWIRVKFDSKILKQNQDYIYIYKKKNNPLRANLELLYNASSLSSFII
jgi:phage anti-repressor protein